MRWLQFHRLLALLIFLTAPQAWSALACWAPFDSQFEQIRTMDQVLRTKDPEHYRIHNDQTVFYSGQVDADGHMYFEIPGGLGRLGTRYEGIPGTDTPYGDLRLPLFILGPELATLFGWEFKILDPKLGLNGPLQMKIPGAKLYEKRILQLNEVLVAEGKEPISILPRRAGLLVGAQMLRFALDTAQDIELSFPNADQNAKLSPHEATYHLNIIFPKELMRRGRNITALVSNFSQILRRSGNTELQKYADAIEEARMLELDAGTALSSIAMSKWRSETFFGKPIERTYAAKALIEHVAELKDYITVLSRPTLTAFEVLVQHLVMSDKGFGAYLRRMEPLWMDNLRDLSVYPKDNLHGLLEQQKVDGEEEAHHRLYLLLKDYKEIQKSQILPSLEPRRDSTTWAGRILESIQQRSEEIASALRKVREREARQK